MSADIWGKERSTFLTLLAERVVVLQKSHLHGSVCLPDVAGCSGVCDALICNPAEM